VIEDYDDDDDDDDEGMREWRDSEFFLPDADCGYLLPVILSTYRV
jgi:hypothetical protein